MEEQAANKQVESGQSAGGQFWRDLGLILVLLLLAGGIRAWLIGHTEVTARDSIGFIRYAWQLEDEPWREVLKKNPHPPAYPLAILAVSLPVRHFLESDSAAMQLSAQLANGLAGILLVVPMFFLGKHLFNRRVGFWAAALVQCLPVGGRMMSDGLSEGLFLLLIATGLLLAVHALRKGSVLLFGLCGLCAALAYLTRPEGMLIMAAAGLVLLGVQVVPGWRLPWKRTLACGASLVLTTVAVGAPYAWVIGSFTNKQTGREIFQVDGSLPGEEGNLAANPASPEAPVAQAGVNLPLVGALWAYWSPDFIEGRPHRERLTWGLLALAKEVNKGFHYLGWLPMLAGLWWFRDRLRTSPGAWVVLTLASLHVLTLLRLAVVMGYVSNRHTLVLVLCGSFWTVAAVEAFGCWLSTRSLQRWPALAERRLPRAETVLLALLVAYSLPVTLKPLHTNRAGHHAAGLWLAQHARPQELILDPFCWAEYYAGRVVGESHPPGYTDGQRPSYVVFGRSVTNEHARLPWISEARRWKERGQLVYHWEPSKHKEAEGIDVYYVPPAVTP